MVGRFIYEAARWPRDQYGWEMIRTERIGRIVSKLLKLFETRRYLVPFAPQPVFFDDPPYQIERRYQRLFADLYKINALKGYYLGDV